MNGPTLTRRILKARAKRTIARFSRPCIAAACLLLAFTVLARAFSVYAGGALWISGSSPWRRDCGEPIPP